MQTHTQKEREKYSDKIEWQWRNPWNEQSEFAENETTECVKCQQLIEKK